MSNIYIDSEGKCPLCGSEALSWNDSDTTDSSIYYDFTCLECGADGREWCNITYHSPEILNETEMREKLPKLKNKEWDSEEN